MKKSLRLIILILTVFIFTQYQSAKGQNKFAKKVTRQDLINPDDFSLETFKEAILIEINLYRHSKSLDTLIVNKVLEKAATDQANYMAKKNLATLSNTGNKKTTAARVKLYGGSKNVEEIVGKINLNKGDEYFTYQKVAEDLVANWVKNKKNESVIIDHGYIFAGISAGLDKDGKKSYVSVVFGNYTSINKGTTSRKKLRMPYTTHSYGIKPFNKKICRKCLKYTVEIEQLRKGISVQNGKVYLKVSDSRIVKKLFKNPTDGIAIDLVQKDQYSCDGDNIVDFNLVNKGVLLHPIYSKSLIKLNTVTDKKSKNYEACLGKIPKALTGDYEINLLIIQNKTVCRSVSQSYIETQKAIMHTPAKLLLDLKSIKTDSDYHPVPETSTLTFTVPFEQNKYTYKQSDIEPFINSLHEPDFSINEVTIAAYSSIEGDAAYNEKLQQQRANSIVEALKSRQTGDIKTTISTDNTWDKFCDDVKGTKFEKLSTMTMEDANKFITQQNWQKELEPILAKHRYAEIVLSVVYDIRGAKEQDFVLSKFNKTVKNKNITDAFSIQKYIIKCVLLHRYTSKAISDMDIPDDKMFTVLINNKLVLQLLATESLPTEDNCKILGSLLKNEPRNIYLYYNNLYCSLLNNEISNISDLNDMQGKIDDLYNDSAIAPDIIDALNLELQFSTLRLLDSIDVPKEVLAKSFDKIKSIVKIEETDWQSAMKLANLFISHNDYEYSGNLMDAFIDQNVSEDYLFTYLSLCSHSQERIMSNKFANAAKQANKLNQRRFCNLFNGDRFSFQVFDNPKVKDIYCKNCVKK